jgi:hypothetical protein
MIATLAGFGAGMVTGGIVFAMGMAYEAQRARLRAKTTVSEAKEDR